ncbi:type IV pilus assembly protein FimV, partial [Mycobacterium tuberculosis]
MKRIVSSVAAVAASLWLTSASALGLGEIQVRSHLNQRFDAIIPLTSVSAEEAADLRVGVADAADFARAGLEHAD